MPAPDARRERRAHPKGFEPGWKFDPDSRELSEVSLVVTDVPENEAAWRKRIKEVTTFDIPEHREVILTDTRMWGNPEAPNIYLKWIIRDRPDPVGAVDAVAILRSLRKNRRRATPIYNGGATLNASWNDWQAHKNEGGGIEGLLDRFHSKLDATEERARELRTINRDLGELLIIGGGDMIEGCSIFPNQMHETGGDLRQQRRDVTAMILEGLDRLAPHFSRVTCLVVGGNHGENRVNGHRVNRHDNSDCEVFENAAVGAARDPRLSHVNFVIAKSEPAKTVDVHGWIVGTTHGHVYGKGVGVNAEVKARNWWRNQAAGRQPIGDADLFITHHFHHWQLRDWGSCLWVQTPALDGGSPFFTDFSGEYAKAGMLTWVTHPGSRFTDGVIL
jgi:hypothetical protein